MADKTMTFYDPQTGEAAAVKLVETASGDHLVGASIEPAARVFEATLALDTDEYASGDVLCEPVEIPNFFSPGGKRRLVSVMVNDKDAQGAAFDLLFLRSEIAIGDVNTAVDIDPDDAQEVIGQAVIGSDDYIDLTSCKLAIVGGLDALLQAAAGATSLWIAAISRGTPTHTASGITLKIGAV